MKKRRGQLKLTGLHPQQSNIFFSIEPENVTNCGHCLLPVENPVRPCACNSSNHDLCLLLYIKRRIIRQLKQKQQSDLSTFKCKDCNQRYYIQFAHQVQRSCGTLCQKLALNCCNKYIILLIVMLAMMLVTVTLCFLYLGNSEYKNNNRLKYGLISACVVEVLIFAMLLYGCLETNLTVRRLVLYKVYDMTDPEVRSLQSENSDDNKVSQSQEIIINK